MNNILDFDSIFEECIENGWTYDQCIKLYPALSENPVLANELNEALEGFDMLASLQALPPQPTRLVTSIRAEYLSAVKALAADQAYVATSNPTPKIALPDRIRSAKRHAINEWEKALARILAPNPLGKLAVTAVTSLAVVSLSATTVAFAAETLPGDFLYPVKVAAERLELGVKSALNPKAGSEYRRSFDQIRMEEVEKALFLGRLGYVSDLKAVIIQVEKNTISTDTGLKIRVPVNLWRPEFKRNEWINFSGNMMPGAIVNATEIKLLIANPVDYTFTEVPTPTPTSTSTVVVRPTRRATLRPVIRRTPTRRPIWRPTATRVRPTPVRTRTPIIIVATPTATAIEITQTPVVGTPTAIEITQTPTVINSTPTTPVDGTLTVVPTETPIETIVPTETTVAPTETPVAPTDTPIPAPTDTPVPLPTDTPIPPPTHTPAPTATPIPPPTATPEPPPADTPQPSTNARTSLFAWWHNQFSLLITSARFWNI